MTLIEKLTYLSELELFIKKLSPSAQTVFLKHEFEKLYVPETDHAHPIIEYRWLKFKQKILEYFSTDSQAEIETRIHYYTLLCQKCEKLIKEFAISQKLDTLSEIDKAIKNQLPVIFNKYLNKATADLIIQIQHNPSLSFSAEAVISKATELYKKDMCEETLLEYEIFNLVNFRITYKTLRDELDEVNAALAVTSLTELRLAIFRQFKEELNAIDYATLQPGRLDSIITQFFQTLPTRENAKTAIDRVVAFEFKATDLQKLMNSTLEEANRLSATPLPTPGDNNIPIPTQDKKVVKINALIKLIKQFREHLSIKQTAETATYTNRNKAALESREKALNDMELIINQTNEVTPLVREIVQNSIDMIKAAEPSWFERDLLSQFLDLISLGPIMRYFTVTAHPAETGLYKLAKEELDSEPEKGAKDAEGLNDSSHP